MIKVRQSAIRNFAECRREHHFQYTRNQVPVYVGRRMPSKSGTRETGTAVHKGIEVLDNGYTLSDALSAVTAIVDEMRSTRLTGELPELSKVDDPKWWDVERYAYAMTTTYRNWVEAGQDTPGSRVLVTEWAWEVPLYDDVHVHGTIDNVHYDPKLGGEIIRDVKSVSNFSQIPRNVDFQLLTYAWAYWRSTGTVPKKAEHLMVKRVLSTKDMTTIMPHRIPVNLRILEAHEEVLKVRVKEMLAAEGSDPTDPVLYPNPGRECSWRCSYKELCDMVQADEDWEDMLEFNYTEKDGDE
jgi:hypothetical protein